MKKVVILISHIPNPRILKRIRALEDDFNISLIYWDRGQENKEQFEINAKNNIFKLCIKAQQGNMVKRIIPLTKYTQKAISLLKNENPDFIHAGNLDMLLIARIYKKFFNKHVKIIYEVADLPKYAFTKKANNITTCINQLIQFIEKKLTSNISKIILTSPYFWEEYFSKFIEKSKYLFIPNAPSKLLFSNYEKQDRNNFTIGFIGSVRYVEQLKLLIDAVDELDRDIKILIAGNGPGYKEILEYSRGKCFVEIYGPYNYEKEIVDLYSRIDCVYSVYNSELENVKIALPNRLYESIVCGLPIIASKETMLGDFIEKHNIGINIDYDDKEELKYVLVKLIDSDKLVDFYQENCNAIKSNYYYENSSKKLLQTYTTI